MKAAAFLILAGAAICLAIAMADEFSSGDAYSAASTLRLDQNGASIWYEALQKTGVAAERNYAPLDSVAAKGLIVFLGYSPFALTDKANTETLENVAKAGKRVVLTMDDSLFTTEKVKPWDLEIQPDKKPEERTFDEEDEALQWHTHFAASSAWQVERKLAGKPIVIERQFGKGSIALVAATKPFLNQAMRDNRDTALLDWVRGDSNAITFDESHLGSVEHGTIVGLIRRFRLPGVALALFAASLLFVWRASVPFPPVREPAAVTTFKPGTGSGDALRNLLERRIPPANLLRVCVDEWSRDFQRRAGPDTAREASRIATEQTSDRERWEKIRAIVRHQRTS